MFAIKLRPLYHLCDKVIIRNLRSSRLGNTNPGSQNITPGGSNPGLNKRIGAFRQEGLRIEDEDAEEFIEQSESDFYNVGEAYNEHMNETLMGKYDLKHQIVKEKYFKENMPNLLTWSEKEQIRHLVITEPNEWTLERIAESFPVTVPVAKKLLKYPWKPATEQRIARHDASVMRNWRELKEGTFEIPEDLRQHFLKFSNRVIPPLNKKSIKIELTPEKDLGEFESIVRRCAGKEKSKENNKYELRQIGTEDSNNENSEKHTFVKKDAKRVTLDELTARIKKRIDKGTNVNEPDKIILDTVKTTNVSKVSTAHPNEEIELFKEDKQNELTEYKEKETKPSTIMDYPERIRVPKKAYKRGATYKVNDCFYDHDGKFLYRVIGM